MLVFIDDATGRLVAPVYSRLTEGVDTPDVKDAEALLEALDG